MSSPCGAETRSGTPCRKPPSANGRCALHGGTTPKGALSPQSRQGGYSQYLPARLQKRYQEADADLDLLSLRRDLALTDVRLSELAERLATGESGELWQALGKQMIALRGAEQKANRTDDDKEREALRIQREQAIDALERIIVEAQQNESVWAEIEGRQQHRRRLAEAETKRLVALQQIITAEQALTRDEAIFAVITRHVTDPHVLSAIGAELVQLADIQPGRAALPVRRPLVGTERGRRR